MYSIVDIETTGNGIHGNRITEIAIFKYDGHDIIDEFTSLVNPQCDIPYFITGLTGIDNAMVRTAPLWEEIAPQVLEFTKDTIFVAHNVNFDYPIIKHQLKSVGLAFSRKKLCTVRLSRQLLPGHSSYSLGKLCAATGIPLLDRHRARGDAHATALLFHRLLRTDNAPEVFKKFLNARSQEATLPAGLPRSEYEKLSTAPGIYYFKDAKGNIIYVGKAINIKKRVLGHFYDKADKEVALCAETCHLDQEETGSELIALLRESSEIKRHYPKYNRAQKKLVPSYAIFSYEDRNGILHLAYNKLKMAPMPLKVFYSPTACRSFLEEVCEAYGLCPKYCHLQENVAQCNHYKLKTCMGICKDSTLYHEYNQRVAEAIRAVKEKQGDYAIQTKGRSPDELGFVLIQENQYQGFGFFSKENTIRHVKDLEDHLIRQKNTLETQRIMENYLAKNSKSVMQLEKIASEGQLP